MRDGSLRTYGFSPHPAIGISRELITVNGLIEKPSLDGPGCHPFRDLSGSGGFPSIIARRLRPCFFAPSPEKRLFPFHFGALWFRRWSPAPGFALILSYCFAAVHLGSAGNIVGPQFGCRGVERDQPGKGDPHGRGFPESKVELERLAAEDHTARTARV